MAAVAVGRRRGLELGRWRGKVAKGGFSGSCIEPRAPAHADNHLEPNLHPKQRSLEDSDVNSLPYLISSQFFFDLVLISNGNRLWPRRCLGWAWHAEGGELGRGGVLADRGPRRCGGRALGHGKQRCRGLHRNRARRLGQPVGRGYARQGFGLVGQFQGRSRIRPMAFYKKKPFQFQIFYTLQTNSNQI
jgi:hypothetical protein